MRKDTTEKLIKIQELIKQKEDIDRQLELLLNPNTGVPLPVNFSINDEILVILRENPNVAKSAKEILASLQTKFPSVDRKKINSALVYLCSKKKSLVERPSYGMYKIIIKQEQPANQG